jgi:hypothetical protein
MSNKWDGLTYEELAELAAGMHSLRTRSRLEKEIRAEMAQRDSDIERSLRELPPKEVKR